ncbi:Gfo/Idh/MocA family oxidoreductase [Limibacter armeniacum]|uniref:Gfo/Idh/MocA family protein n=1 Tax=Limibacter armeniacum TaxID=466084 RepID=UPI002FE5BC25
MTQKIKWGIIGPGKIASAFANDFKYAGYCALHAIASRDDEKAKTFAEEFGAAKAYGSYEALYADPEVEAVYIATPHNFHFECAKAALEAGKAVLCEKPITINPSELHSLIETAKANDTYLMEGMWTYFLPAIQKAQQWVAEGRIGEVRHIKADFGFKVPFDPHSRLFNPNLAGGTILDIGIYNIAMATLFFHSKPTSMQVMAQKAPTGVDSDVNMLFEYPNGRKADLHTSFNYMLPNFAHIIGENGFISIPNFWQADACTLHLEGGIEKFEAKRQGFGFSYQIEAVSKDLLEGKKMSDTVPHSVSMLFQEVMEEVVSHFN